MYARNVAVMIGGLPGLGLSAPVVSRAGVAPLEPFPASSLSMVDGKTARFGEHRPERRVDTMDSHGLIAWLVIGAIAGWLAGTFVKGGGFGLLGDIVVGIIGAFIGGWMAGVLHIHVGTGWISAIITAAAGAVLLLVVLRLVRRAA